MSTLASKMTGLVFTIETLSTGKISESHTVDSVVKYNGSTPNMFNLTTTTGVVFEVILDRKDLAKLATITGTPKKVPVFDRPSMKIFSFKGC